MQARPFSIGRRRYRGSAATAVRMAQAVIACAALACGDISADTLADARQLSRLGEPLRLVIPVRPDGGPPLEERCLGVAGSRESDGLPHILTASVVVEREGSARNVVITTSAPVREPVSRLVLRTACDGTSRQYTLFLEPPGSTRQVRSVGQSGPTLAGGSPLQPKIGIVAEGAAPPVASPGAAPVVTVIPVVPSRTAPPPAKPPSTIAPPPSPLIGLATVPNLVQPARTENEATPRLDTPAAATAPQALQVENENLKQQLAMLNDELQRLQQTQSGTQPAAVATTAAPHDSSSGLPRWEIVWPVLVALAGLSALTIGGFMWRRRHAASDEWALTGPPSPRVASRTSLAEEPVTFRQVGLRTDVPSEVMTHDASSAAVASPESAQASVSGPPAALRLQPSTEDLARELEQELFVAEHAHSALERAHPDIIEALTRSWGTAAARQHLARMLEAGSAELARMSSEAVAELRLLLRIAEDSIAPAGNPHPSPATLTPPAHAW